MPRQLTASAESNFSNGLITEATALNFPENACTELYDCEINLDGSIKRRLGFDFENNSTVKPIDRNGKCISTYTWENVAGDGDVSVIVNQIGDTLHFYRISGSSISSGAVASTVTLSPVSGASDVDVVEAQFTDGNGVLVVTHPYCDPIRVRYNISDDTVEATSITLKIRDFEGDSADFYTIDERPTSSYAALPTAHKYNLLNQGWTDATLTKWDSAFTHMPSNSDVAWHFKNANDVVTFTTAQLENVYAGNSPAPKGHFILDLADQDRDTASGLTGVTAGGTGSVRPSTCAFFAGRIFYSGINLTKYNSYIYFTQIIERDEQYGQCYQVNDPTSEKLFDLLPSDGGAIKIQEAGTIVKMHPVPGGLAVIALNGVWLITGSQGLGFTANDYTVQKISSIGCLTHTSFVDIGGTISWWNADGIWTITSEGNIPTVKSLTDPKITSFYLDIPIASKRFARGSFSNIEGIVRWLYRSSATSEINELYEFDRVLNFNVKTGAFFPWRITDSDVKVHGIILASGSTGSVSTETVVDSSAATVTDNNFDEIFIYTSTGNEVSPTDKYIVSYKSGGTYQWTFAETRSTSYTDWFQYDSTGEDFESYFITGYKLRGNALTSWSPVWTNVFSKIEDAVQYQFQGIWDFASTPNGTGRWSPKQLISHTDTNYSFAKRKLKVRGHGTSLQFKVTSVAGEPFHIIGWSSLNASNQLP
jgi:hypothetical protein